MHKLLLLLLTLSVFNMSAMGIGSRIRKPIQKATSAINTATLCTKTQPTLFFFAIATMVSKKSFSKNGVRINQDILRDVNENGSIIAKNYEKGPNGYQERTTIILDPGEEPVIIRINEEDKLMSINEKEPKIGKTEIIVSYLGASDLRITEEQMSEASKNLLNFLKSSMVPAEPAKTNAQTINLK